MIPSMKPSILIVDDHPAFRSQARTLLERHGFSVVGEAGDAASALEAVRRMRPEVVLLDVYLGDVNGFDVAERIRQCDFDTKVVMTSGNELSSFRSRLRRTSALGFVAKTELGTPMLQALLADG